MGARSATIWRKAGSLGKLLTADCSGRREEGVPPCLPASHCRRRKPKLREGRDCLGSPSKLAAESRLESTGQDSPGGGMRSCQEQDPRPSPLQEGDGHTLLAPSSGRARSRERGPETQAGPRSPSTSVNGCAACQAARVPPAAPCTLLSMTPCRDSPCVCSSGPPRSPLLTHLPPLFHLQTLGLERPSNWLAVPTPGSPPCLNRQSCLSCLPATMTSLPPTSLPC